MKSPPLTSRRKVRVPKNDATRHRGDVRRQQANKDWRDRDSLFDEVKRCLENARDQGAGVPNEVLLDKRLEGCRLLLIRTLSETKCPIHLSPREIEISRMIAKGYPNKMIAAVLEISTWTVGTHLRRIFAKLRVSSRAAMVAKLIDRAILSTGLGDPLPISQTTVPPTGIGVSFARR
jgi:DNA-binding CsgD family transcriptional regulator